MAFEVPSPKPCPAPQSSLDVLFSHPTHLLSMLRDLFLHNKTSFHAFMTQSQDGFQNIASALSNLPVPNCSAYSFRQDNHTVDMCHPAFLQVVRPAFTTGDGSCLWNSVSIALNGNEQYTGIEMPHSLLFVNRDTLLPVIAEHVSYFQSNIDPQVKYNDIVLTSLTLGAWGEYYHIHALAVVMNVPIFQYCTFRHSKTNMCLLDSSLSPSGLVEAFRRREHFTRETENRRWWFGWLSKASNMYILHNHDPLCGP